MRLTKWQKWQIGQYLVNKIFPEEDTADSPAAKRASIILNGGSRGELEDSDRQSESDDGYDDHEEGESSKERDSDEEDQEDKSFKKAMGASHSDPYESR